MEKSADCKDGSCISSDVRQRLLTALNTTTVNAIAQREFSAMPQLRVPTHPNLVSPTEIKDLLNYLREAKNGYTEVREFLSENPEKIFKLVTWPCSWASIYEYPLAQHIAIVAVAMEAHTDIQSIAESSNRMEAMKKFIDGIEPPTWLGDEEQISKASLFFCSWYALLKSVRCIELTGNTINGLIQKAREGDTKAILDAVRADPTAINSPTIASFAAFAELMNDYDFLKALSNAVARPFTKPKVDYGELRFALTLLQETGQLEKMSEENRYQLLSLDLGLYPSEGGGADSLNKFIRRWQKSLRT